MEKSLEGIEFQFRDKRIRTASECRVFGTGSKVKVSSNEHICLFLKVLNDNVLDEIWLVSSGDHEVELRERTAVIASLNDYQAFFGFIFEK